MPVTYREYDDLSPIRAARRDTRQSGAEGVALVGWSLEGGGSVGVIGVVLGLFGEHQNNIVVATGKEWMYGEDPQNIKLREVNIGIPIFGVAGVSGGMGFPDTGKECGFMWMCPATF